MASIQARTAGATYVLRSSADDHTCNGCDNTPRTCTIPAQMPQELTGIISPQEFSDLCNRLNQVFLSSAMCMPLALACYCSPMCAMIALNQRKADRMSQVGLIISDFNSRILQPRGAQFDIILEHDVVAVLRVNQAVRQQLMMQAMYAQQQMAGYPPQQMVGYAPQPQMVAYPPQQAPQVVVPQTQGYMPQTVPMAYAPATPDVEFGGSKSPSAPAEATAVGYSPVPQSAAMDRGAIELEPIVATAVYD